MKNFLNKFLKSICYIIFLLPAQIKRGIGMGIGVLWFDVLRLRRKMVIENIKLCFPEMKQDQAVKTGRGSLMTMGISIVEFLDFAFFTKEQLAQKVIFEGLEHIDQAQKENKGAIILGSHMSNGDIGIAALSARGYPMHLISKRFSNKWLDEIWFKVRGRFGTQFIYPRNSSFDILKALKKNGIVIFVLDQFMGPPLGVRTTFFGRPTGTAVGLALFAEKTRVPVIPCYAYRREDGKYIIRFSSPIPFEDQSDKNTTLQYMTQKYTDKIEEIVRSCPEQWMWLHRRWKAFND